MNCLGSTGLRSVCWAAAASRAGLLLLRCSGGLNPWCANVTSAEREAWAAGHQEYQRHGRPIAHSHLAQCGLTRRSSGAPTLGITGTTT